MNVVGGEKAKEAETDAVQLRLGNLPESYI